MNNLFIELGGRRYIFAMVSLIIITLLCAFNRINGGEFVAALGIVNVIYSGANTYQKVKGAPNEPI